MRDPSQLGGGVVRTIALGSTDGLRCGLKVANTEAPISVPVGQKTLGRIINVLGEPIDEKGPIGAEVTWPSIVMRRNSSSFRRPRISWRPGSRSSI